MGEEKGRVEALEPGRRGPARKFSSKEVWSIRWRRSSGETIAELAAEHGVNRRTIRSVLYGRGAYRDV